MRIPFFNDINPTHHLLIKAKTIMRLNIQLIYTATVLLIGSVSGFISPLKQNRINKTTTKSHHSTKHQLLQIRGGGDTSSSTALQMHLGPVLKEALVSGMFVYSFV